MSDSRNRSGFKRSAGGGNETVFLSGATYNAILDRLEELEAIFDPNFFDYVQKKDGKHVTLKDSLRAAVEGMAGPFCKVFKSTTGETTSWKLLGGVVYGGGGTVTIPDITLATVGEEPVDGTHFWIEASFEALVEADVLMPGGDLTSASVGSGTSVPVTSVPTVASPEGSISVSLGSWSQNKFYPSGCGDITIGHCLGSLTFARG
jgi:hypothetical protein